ncbi:hypothetical protein [Streptomyces sp. NPDC001680]
MPETDIRPRPDVFALLCDTDFKWRPNTGTWSHRDGRPFSKEEQALALRATRIEFEELSAQLARYKEYKRTKDEAPEAFQRFLAPFMEQLRQRLSAHDRGRTDRVRPTPRPHDQADSSLPPVHLLTTVRVTP